MTVLYGLSSLYAGKTLCSIAFVKAVENGKLFETRSVDDFNGVLSMCFILSRPLFFLRGRLRRSMVIVVYVEESDGKKRFGVCRRVEEIVSVSQKRRDEEMEICVQRCEKKRGDIGRD